MKISKLAISNPNIVFDFLINQITSYYTLMNPIIKSLKH